MASAVGINLGSQSYLPVDTVGTLNYGISKIDISPFGASGTLFNGTVGVSFIPQISVGTLPILNIASGSINGTVNIGNTPNLGTIGTLGTALGVGSVGGLGTLPGVGVVSSITNGSINIPNGTLQALGTLGTVGTVAGLGTLPGIGIVTALGTMGTLGTLLGIGSIANIGTINNAGTINAGTINTGTINTGTFVYTGGTLNLIGTTQYVGTLGTLQSIGTLPNIPGGTLQNSGTVTGVGVVTALTNGSIVVTNGTFQESAIPTSKVTNYGTTGTAGAGTSFGTIQGTVGSGTEILLNDVSIIALAGTPTVALGWGTAAIPYQGTMGIEGGVFPAGGGIAKVYTQANHSGTNGFLTYGITGGTAYFKVGYQVVAATV